MKSSHIPYLLLFVAATIFASCTKDFKKTNTDPNRPTDVNPGVLLSQMQYRIVNSSISAARNFTHELMQVDAPRSSSSGGGVHRYDITAGSGSVWTNFYSYLTDIQDIYAIATKLNEPNYKAIALVYKCWAYSILTDLHGDVPYSQATKAAQGIVKPAFDKQKDIYIDLLKTLDTANGLFNATRALTYGGDLVYNANALSGSTNPGIIKWKKLGNSLRLRLLLRLSKKAAEVDVNSQLTKMLADPAQYPVFTANADEGIFRYPGTNPFYNPYYNARQLDWRDGTYFTSFFIDKMNADNDPRRAVWATTVTVSGAPVYRGILSGYPISTIYTVGANSSYTDVLKTSPLIGVMLPYAEVEFIKAELALKGFNTGKTAKQHYEAGITASMAQWGVALPANYLTQPGVAYDAAAATETQLEKIILQKYYAYFFVDYQAWFEKRRTGYPVLPRGTGIPVENQFPYRIPYPTYLQSLNPEALAAALVSMGDDKSSTKVWWDK